MSKGAMWGNHRRNNWTSRTIVGVVLATAMGPGKADYKAGEKLNDVIKVYNETSISLSYVSTSETSLR